ncbi:Hypothetical predicted protein [Mytilus galloprovincialis]|uniref:DZIP3-like HEPN domain-containing protein n=1 Tax=Mytilus galloprovincialis TaxID=29158 RepID=A0A8B6BN12_MYTGA|nr:Hypothetical predicted protein [Mytilus galloprovincialis]
MVCLLKHFTELDIQDRLPLETIHTTAADIARIKFYRNYIVHSDSGKVTENTFSEIWNCVVEAIIRLVPDLKSKIDALMSSSLTNDSDITDVIRLEKEINKTNQHLSIVSQKLEKLEIENNNNREIHNRTLKEWIDKDTKYISTSATTFILQSLKQNRGVIITGCPGCGKSVTGHHVALTLEKKGYEIIPCDDPGEILKHFKAEKNQVFVIDDICESDNLYTAIHDKMFDIISAAIAPSILKCLIEYVDIAFIAHRIQLLSCSQGSLPFVVYIPQDLERCYLKRQYEEAMKGKYWEVFGGIQAENKTYRSLLLSFLNERDMCQEITYVPDEDGVTPLFVASYLGYVDFAEYFIVRCPCHIDVKDKEGRSSFYVACENGHIAMVKYFMKFHYDINDENTQKTTALSATCLNGHTEVAQLLLDNKADPNKTNKLNRSTIYFACLNGNVKLVKLLLYREYDLDITIKDVFGNTALHVACGKGHTDTVKVLLEFGMNIKEKEQKGLTPLHLACRYGCYDTVKYLIDLIYLEQKKQNRFVADELKNFHETKDGSTILHIACCFGHTEIVKLLINVGMDVNDVTINSITPLHLACRKGHFAIVKFLIDLKDQQLISCVDKTIKDKKGGSVLHTACHFGHTEIVKLLINVGMDVNDVTINSITPLHLACQNGHFAIVKFLIDLKDQPLISCVDKTIKDNKGRSVLHTACYFGHTEIVKVLTNFGININDTESCGCTPLQAACQNGQFATVKYLLDLKDSAVDRTIKDEIGRSVLHTACYSGHTETVKLLIDVGMNVNDTSSYGCTPLYQACVEGHYEIVKLLLNLKDLTFKSCVDRSLKSKTGWSVLHAACYHGHTKIVKVLIDFGLNVNDTLSNGSTPLHLACQKGHYDTVKFLLDLNRQTLNSCVDITVKDKNGWSVLHAACFHGHSHIVKLLIDVGMNINDTSTNSSTPLFLACEKGHHDTVKLLLDLNGGQISNSRVIMTIKNKDGWTVLHIACCKGHTEVIQLLIDAGMNVNDTTPNGSTPLSLACMEGHYDTVKL